MKDLGLQAAARVVRADNPLKTLRDISGNFPSMARPPSPSSLAALPTLRPRREMLAAPLCLHHSGDLAPLF